VPRTEALGKEFSIFFLCRVPSGGALSKVPVNVICLVTITFLCRVLSWHSAKPLPSARQKTLGKEVFADDFFAVYSLPSAALGKAFAEGKMAFAECACVSSSVDNCCAVQQRQHRRTSVTLYLFNWLTYLQHNTLFFCVTLFLQQLCCHCHL
jgi:hypothetical protein